MSIPLDLLFNESEKELNKRKNGRYNQFNHLWKSLKIEYNSVNALTEHIYEHNLLTTKDVIQFRNCDNRYRFPSSIHNDTTDELLF